ncbi:PTS system, fructose-specific IIC component [Sanguibacter gelidistatuariae]|uniref:PTS system, fructose-specific IIC component n=1 Tax=Sanguibacter gelidistatuariae TaxID=1814289 RepID=A0A1G6KL74_9MICO|nr:fructose-specific PTS transporter subunit EIIC [Sanguibacter gelidistatuariae]SDC31581.1 PTS system, fructose-specific IIC component [Sanguibacter gelidistatuariae]
MKFVAVTSCPTGIAHTYMAAEALEQAGKAAGHDVQVETQGSAGTIALDPAVIAAADGVIFAADLEVKDKERFAGKPTIDVGVKKAVHDAKGVLAQAIAAVEAGVVAPAGPTAAAGAASGGLSTKVDKNAGVGTRVRQWLMTGISYMIPFVAAGGILIALAFMLANLAWDVDGPIKVTQVTAEQLINSFSVTSGQDWAALLNLTGGAAFGFLVPVLAGFIAYAIADRPGLVPGFVGGAIAVTVGAGFLGGLAAGFVGGFLALWISRWKVPRGVRGIMPVVVIPLVSTFITGLLMFVVLGRPIAALMDGLTDWLNSLSGGSTILLGVLLGAMMGFDLGGPVNKVAYTFAVTGLATEGLASDATQYRVMAAVMAAGMVAPLAMALATVVRKSLFTHAERENGKAAWLLGASFISEGAIPFAVVDPLRVLASTIVGSAVTGGLVMAFDSTLRAPHGGIWVLPLIGNPILFVLAVIIGTVVCAAIVIVLKSLGTNSVVAAEQAADALAESQETTGVTAPASA